MLDPNLRAYLDTLKKSGHVPAPHEIREAFARAGWSPSEIEESIQYLAPTPPPAPKIPPVVTYQSTLRAVPGEPAPQISQKPAQVSGVQPVQQQPGAVIAPAPRPKAGHRGLYLALLFLILLGVAGVGGYAYREKLGLFSQPPYQISGLASGLLESYLAADSYAYALSVNIDTKPRETDAIAFGGSIPAVPNVQLKLDSTGSVGQATTSATVGKAQISGEGVLADFSFGFSADLVKQGEALFVQLHNLASPQYFPPYDFSGFKERWVRLGDQDIQSLVPSGAVSRITAQDPKLFTEGARLFARLLDSEQIFFEKQGAVKEDLEGVSAYRYDLGVTKDGFARLMRQLGTVDEVFLSSDLFTQAYEYASKNSSLEVWADAKTGALLKIAYSIRWVPPEAAPASEPKQINASFVLALKDVNTPVQVEIPKEALSYDDAMILMRGQRKETYQLEKQRDRITLVRKALEDAKSASGRYPDSLDQLKVFLGVVPNDVLTQKPYGYSATGDAYRLEYEIVIPAFPEALTVLMVKTADTKPRFSLRYVGGINTATARAESEEALLAASKDADGDSLTDVFEAYLGTDPKLRDTDKDGASDFDEVLAGRNPLLKS